ncbi:MAG: HEAT repeat domain-containing protein [Armatimonadota bacterium]|nr:HEAT repeat domain-containing protein [Armatimonadota bacterium]
MSILQRSILVAVAVLTIIPAVADEAAEPPERPDSGRAPFVIAGEPIHGSRVLPIPVLEGHVWAVPRLTEGLDHEDAQVRARCCFLLGQVADRSALDTLAEMLDDPDREVRQFAGVALMRMGDWRGLHAAKSALVGNRWWVRFWAVEAIGRNLWASDIQRLTRNDSDELVRTLAEEAAERTWEPAEAEVAWELEEELTLDDTIFRLTNYIIAETDWWWHAGEYPQILRCLETAVWLDPTWADGYGNAGYLYWSLDRDREALGAYRRGVQILPDSWETNWELGFYYFNALKQYEDAVPLLGRARELGCPREFARPHAHALEKAGHPREALAVWQQLRARYPDDQVVRVNMERLERSLGEG